MKRSEERILTTHVGSLVRPSSLRGEGEGQRAGGADAGAAARLRGAVRDVVHAQVAAGLDVVNDGEYGKFSWSTYILDRLTGFEIRRDRPARPVWLGRDLERFAEAIAETTPFVTAEMPTEVCVGPIEYVGGASVARDIENLRLAAAAEHPDEVFMTAVAPASTAFNGVNEYYPSERDYVFALADALGREYRAIHAAGFVLQVDDAVLANMYDELVRADPAKYREWAQLRIDGLNRALEGIPPERVRYHVCFGSWHVPHVSDAPLEAIVDLILQVNAGAYSIEAANPRHEHEWRVWEQRRLPDGKILIPGVVTHHTTTVEHPRVVADRILRYANAVGRENVIAGTDCGFAQVETIARVHPTVMWAKLEALVEGARIASEELWH